MVLSHQCSDLRFRHLCKWNNSICSVNFLWIFISCKDFVNAKYCYLHYIEVFIGLIVFNFYNSKETPKYNTFLFGIPRVVYIRKCLSNWPWHPWDEKFQLQSMLLKLWMRYFAFFFKSLKSSVYFVPRPITTQTTYSWWEAPGLKLSPSLCLKGLTRTVEATRRNMCWKCSFLFFDSVGSQSYLI